MVFLKSQHLFQSFKYSNTYYITYANFERGLQRNSMTPSDLQYIMRLILRWFFFLQQFLQEQNSAVDYGYLYINDLKLFK